MSNSSTCRALQQQKESGSLHCSLSVVHRSMLHTALLKKERSSSPCSAASSSSLRLCELRVQPGGSAVFLKMGSQSGAMGGKHQYALAHVLNTTSQGAYKHVWYRTTGFINTCLNYTS